MTASIRLYDTSLQKYFYSIFITNLFFEQIVTKYIWCVCVCVCMCVKIKQSIMQNYMISHSKIWLMVNKCITFFNKIVTLTI